MAPIREADDYRRWTIVGTNLERNTTCYMAKAVQGNNPSIDFPDAMRDAANVALLSRAVKNWNTQAEHPDFFPDDDVNQVKNVVRTAFGLDNDVEIAGFTISDAIIFMSSDAQHKLAVHVRDGAVHNLFAVHGEMDLVIIPSCDFATFCDIMTCM